MATRDDEALSELAGMIDPYRPAQRQSDRFSSNLHETATGEGEEDRSGQTDNEGDVIVDAASQALLARNRPKAHRAPAPFRGPPAPSRSVTAPLASAMPIVPPGMINLPKDARPPPPTEPSVDSEDSIRDAVSTADTGDEDAILASASPMPAPSGGGDGEPPASAPAPTPAPAAPPAKAPDLTYETWLRSHPQAPPKGNLSWLSRGAEDVYSGFMRQKPDYRVGNEMDARTNAENAAGPKSYAQWLLAQKTASEVGKNDREGQPKPPGEAPSVAANIKATSAERIADKKNALAAELAKGKDANAVIVAGLRAAVDREEEAGRATRATAQNTSREGIATATNMSHEKTAEAARAAAEGRAVQGDVTKLGAKQTPLAQTFSSFESFKRDFPDAFTGDLSGQSLNWLEKLEASNPLGIPTRGLLPADKQRLDRMQQNFVDVVKRARTGAQANSNEDRTYARILGLDLSAHPEAFPEAIRDFASAFQTQLRSNERSVRPQAVGRFTEGGGVPSSNAEVFQKSAATPAATPGHVRMRDPEDGHVEDVPEADVQRAISEFHYERL